MTTDQRAPPPIDYVEKQDGSRIAYRLRRGPAAGPTLLFLPGYASDMDGSKALALDCFAERRGLPLLRFDYGGTGKSEGSFEQGTLASWLNDALLVADELTQGPLVAIGSSMGGWLALHLALRRPERVAALVGIAAAPDFTEWGYGDEQKARLQEAGRLERPNPYGEEPQLTTLAFWQSGQEMRLLGSEIAVDCPVRLLHGDRDEDVPLTVAMELMGALRSADVQLTILKNGGHRLSEPQEIDAILRSIEGLLEI